MSHDIMHDKKIKKGHKEKKVDYNLLIDYLAQVKYLQLLPNSLSPSIDLKSLTIAIPKPL